MRDESIPLEPVLLPVLRSVTDQRGSGPPAETFYFELEDASGSILMEDGASFLLQEEAP